MLISALAISELVHTMVYEASRNLTCPSVPCHDPSDSCLLLLLCSTYTGHLAFLRYLRLLPLGCTVAVRTVVVPHIHRAHFFPSFKPLLSSHLPSEAYTDHL